MQKLIPECYRGLFPAGYKYIYGKKTTFANSIFKFGDLCVYYFNSDTKYQITIAVKTDFNRTFMDYNLSSGTSISCLMYKLSNDIYKAYEIAERLDLLSLMADEETVTKSQ